MHQWACVHHCRSSTRPKQFRTFFKIWACNAILRTIEGKLNPFPLPLRTPPFLSYVDLRSPWGNDEIRSQVMGRDHTLTKLSLSQKDYEKFRT